MNKLEELGSEWISNKSIADEITLKHSNIKQYIAYQAFESGFKQACELILKEAAKKNVFIKNVYTIQLSDLQQIIKKLTDE